MEVAEDMRTARWLIDAWLPAEGAVFISLRAARDDLWGDVDVDDGDDDTEAPAVALVLRAPEFEPEHVDRRVAFGAVQRGAQEGFSAVEGGAEFPFESVSQVTDFVRRVYAGSGPGSTGGGDGPGPLPGNIDGGGPRIELPRLPVTDGGDPVGGNWSLPPTASVDAAGLARQMGEASSKSVRAAAANLLIGSIEAALEHADATLVLDRVEPLMHAVFLLTAGVDRLWEREFWASINKNFSIPDIDFWWQPFLHQRRVGTHDLATWRLAPSQLVQLGMPPKVRTWLDAMAYLRADRSYFSQRVFSEWGPLMLALLAPLCRDPDTFALPRSFHAPLQVEALVTRSMRTAASMLPTAVLPAALEQNIEKWCREGGQLPGSGPNPDAVT